jgi:hypothetical protein
MEVPSEATNIAPEEPRTEGTPGVGGVSGFIPPTTAYCGRTLRARLIWFRGKGNRIKHPAHRIPPAAKISTHAEIIRILLIKPVDMFDRLLDALPVETGSSPPQPKD